MISMEKINCKEKRNSNSKKLGSGNIGTSLNIAGIPGNYLKEERDQTQLNIQYCQNMASLEDVLSQAKQKGLVVVNSEESSSEKWEKEMQKTFAEADRLCEIVDPETKPFDSKYKAREILDELLKNLEGSKAIATLEKKLSFIEDLRKFIAKVQLRIGTISWDCEEPHNAQTELESACKYYFPDLVSQIDSFVSDKDETLTQGEESDQNKLNEFVAEIENNFLPKFTPLADLTIVSDSMKCLNLLGILWAGRGQPLKSLCFLLSVSECYEDFQRKKDQSRENPISNEEIENTFTHNLFYLAQAFGNLKMLRKSSFYCQKTLQRQFSSGLLDLKSALEWVKNCCGIADFYFAMKHNRLCGLALSSAEKILKEKIIKTLYEEMERQQKNEKENEKEDNRTNHRPNFVSENLNAAEIEADLHRRFASLDVQILRDASERWKELQLSVTMNMEKSLIEGSFESSEEENEEMKRLLSNKTKENDEEMVFLFDGLPVAIIPFQQAKEINSFETARIVFLRAVNRIELAKKYFVLDGSCTGLLYFLCCLFRSCFLGYVTDHSNLVQDHSKLFHYLNAFEIDFKRKIAMESRRVELLSPLVRSLNRLSYEALHKQVFHFISFSFVLPSSCCCLIFFFQDFL
jgi:hypothetical protein